MRIRDRIIELRRVKACDLRPNPKNWRCHPENQQNALRGVLAEIGMADVLVARELPDGTLELVDGHLRAETIGGGEVPVVVLDVTAEEADTLLATMDPICEMATVDDGKLNELLESVSVRSDALREMLDGIRPAVAAGELPGADESAAAKLDRADELRETWATERGQLWIVPCGNTDGSHRILCGDSRQPESFERLFGDAKARWMWTDPPYGVDYVGKSKDALTIENDSAAGLPALLEKAFSAVDSVLGDGAPIYVAHPAGRQGLVFGEQFTVVGWRLHQVLVWVKDRMVLGHSDHHMKHEPILYGWKGKNRHWYGDRKQVSVFEVERPTSNKEHPTMKPPQLVMDQLANSSRPGDLGVDPFLGSGTTLVAAEQLGRRCYGVELSPGYVAVILQRMKDMGLEPRLEK